jgi:FHS family L-fucose permease-like MFS transporter
VLIYFVRLPEIRETSGAVAMVSEPVVKELRGIWRHKHLIKGVLAQFLYVGAQVGVTSFVIRFAQHTVPGTPERGAANYLWWHLFGFMVGRFGGSAIMKRIAPPRLLGLFAGGAFACTAVAVVATGKAPIWAVVLIGFFHSIMFPTIFALSLKNLGLYTKLGSSLLVMSIIGGAIVPALMGRISDLTNIQKAFLVPLLCYLYIFYFAVWGYKPTVRAPAKGLPTAGNEAE